MSHALSLSESIIGNVLPNFNFKLNSDRVRNIPFL